MKISAIRPYLFNKKPASSATPEFTRRHRGRNKAIGNMFPEHFPLCVNVQREGVNLVTASYDTITNPENSEVVNLSQMLGSKYVSVKLEKIGKNKKTTTNFKATIEPNSVGGCEYISKKNAKEPKKTAMFWKYPEMTYIFQGNKEEAMRLQNALLNLQNTINSENYCNDFGNTKSLNQQLSMAIEYLSKKIN